MDREELLLMAMAAHDLGSPLMVVSTAIRVLGTDGLTPEERSDWLARGLRNTASLERSVADFADIVAARNGRLQLTLKEVELCELAAAVVRDYGAAVQSHPLSFQGTGACSIVGDEERLKRMLWNLLSNAMKFSARGRPVAVTVWEMGERICLTVQDQGVGIAPADVERLFLPFRRLDRTGGQVRGSGLGLTSVQEIVRNHGGTIHIQGVPRQGTTVEVCFPARRERRDPQ